MTTHGDFVKIFHDDELAKKIAHDCNDRDHDDRWCPTCQNRENAIFEYRQAVIDRMTKEFCESRQNFYQGKDVT